MTLSVLSVLFLPSLSLANTLTSCSLQRDCISFTVEENTSSTCSSSSCLWKVCLRYDTGLPGCQKDGSISHVCDSGNDSTGCARDGWDNGGWDANEIENFGDSASMCVYGAKFLLKDGWGCEGFESFGIAQGSAAQCFPSPERTFTGNRPGRECWWTVTTPGGSCAADVPIPTNRPTIPPTKFPTQRPSPLLTAFPTRRPTPLPTKRPTPFPTASPTRRPTPFPTAEPTSIPAHNPTSSPTSEPTPVPTSKPTSGPTSDPTSIPTSGPTSAPTPGPTVSMRPSMVPSFLPSSLPSLSAQPSLSSMPSSTPSSGPTPAPTVSANPTNRPSESPSSVPSRSSQPSLSSMPSLSPSFAPTRDPTSGPTSNPTSTPTSSPTSTPIPEPSNDPTREPTPDPTFAPTFAPTNNPTKDPTAGPTTLGPDGPARPLTSCSLQRDCIAFAVEEASSNSCGDGSCLWKVCLQFDSSLPGCQKEGAISRACDSGDDLTGCLRDVSDNGGWDSTETIPFDDLESMCVYVPKGEEARFLLKEGGKCEGSEAFAIEDSNSFAVCSPSEEKTCTGNRPGVECWWRVSTPRGDRANR